MTGTLPRRIALLSLVAALVALTIGGLVVVRQCQSVVDQEVAAGFARGAGISVSIDDNRVGVVPAELMRFFFSTIYHIEAIERGTGGLAPLRVCGLASEEATPTSLCQLIRNTRFDKREFVVLECTCSQIDDETWVFDLRLMISCAPQSGALGVGVSLDKYVGVVRQLGDKTICVLAQAGVLSVRAMIDWATS